MSKLQKLSNNDLLELDELLGAIRKLIGADYAHVSDNIDPEIKRIISKQIADVEQALIKSGFYD